MIERFHPGRSMFAVLRDDSDEPVTVAGYIYLARVSDVVFASPGINGCQDLGSILCYLMSCTQDDEELPLVAVPVEDCYATREAAKEAMQNEQC